MSAGWGGAEGGNLQADPWLSPEPNWPGALTNTHEITTWAKTKSHTLNQLHCPGPPKVVLSRPTFICKVILEKYILFHLKRLPSLITWPQWFAPMYLQDTSVGLQKLCPHSKIEWYQCMASPLQMGRLAEGTGGYVCQLRLPCNVLHGDGYRMNGWRGEWMS